MFDRTLVTLRLFSYKVEGYGCGWQQRNAMNLCLGLCLLLSVSASNFSADSIMIT